MLYLAVRFNEESKDLAFISVLAKMAASQGGELRARDLYLLRKRNSQAVLFLPKHAKQTVDPFGMWNIADTVGRCTPE